MDTSFRVQPVCLRGVILRVAMMCRLVLAQPVLLHSQGETQLSPALSGTSGRSFNLTCGPQHALVGIVGGKGIWVDWVQGQCRQVTVDGLWIGDMTLTDPSGNKTGSYYELECPGNHAVGALSGFANQPGASTVVTVSVTQLQIHCRPLGLGGMLTGTASPGDAVGMSGGFFFGPGTAAPVECAQNRPARALIGSATQVLLGTSVVERIGLNCLTPEVFEFQRLTMPVSATGSSTITGTAEFNRAVPTSLTVRLSSSSPVVATVPGSVQFAKGQRSRSFPITLGSPSCATITATYTNSTQSRVIIVHPPVNSGALVALSVDERVTLGAPRTATVRVSSSRGAVVTLSTSDARVVTVPASVSVPPGSPGTAQVPITLGGAGCATITATYSGSSHGRTMRVF